MCEYKIYVSKYIYLLTPNYQNYVTKNIPAYTWLKKKTSNMF